MTSDILEFVMIIEVSMEIVLTLFYAGVGIYAHPRDFALAEAMMHQNL